MPSQVWTAPVPMTPRDLFRFCARRALLAARAGQGDAARFWLSRAEIFAARVDSGLVKERFA